MVKSLKKKEVGKGEVEDGDGGREMVVPELGWKSRQAGPKAKECAA